MPTFVEPVAFTIAGKRFTMLPRYTAGHALTEGEANALNQTLRENIRNNLATEADLTQERVDEYATNYAFGTRTGTSKRTREEVALDQVITTELRAAAKAAGKTLPKGEALTTIRERFYEKNRTVIDEKVRVLLSTSTEALELDF
jgi:hypothetical protein